MSDMHPNFGALPHERPGDDDAREARHQVLATLLGAYADGELPAETSSQIDAHLLGCARCRREVDIHAAVRTRLSIESTVSASPALRERIRAQIARTPMPAAVAPPAPWWRSTGARIAVASALVTGIAVFALVRVQNSRAASRPMSTVEVSAVPLLGQVLDDYRRVFSGDLPGRARDLDAVRASVPFPVEPLQAPDLRLVAAWSTNLEGEPAAVLAYRRHDRLVFQYLISEPTFFRHSGLRIPIAGGSLVSASSGAQAMVAWAAPESGAILVGDVSPGELSALRVGSSDR